MELKNKPHAKGTKQIFKNRFLERLSRTHIAIPLVVFSIISTGLIIYGLQNQLVASWKILPLFMLGVLVFSLVEYLMHRYLFHLAPKTEKQEKFAYTVHGVHHDYPKDKDRLAMPIPLSLTLTVLFYLFFRLIMGDLVYGFLPGFLIGYASYLWVHYMVHAFQPPKNFWKVLWVHHGIHHYKDPGNAFGVSSPLWDMIFARCQESRLFLFLLRLFFSSSLFMRFGLKKSFEHCIRVNVMKSETNVANIGL